MPSRRWLAIAAVVALSTARADGIEGTEPAIGDVGFEEPGQHSSLAQEGASKQSAPSQRPNQRQQRRKRKKASFLSMMGMSGKGDDGAPKP